MKKIAIILIWICALSFNVKAQRITIDDPSEAKVQKHDKNYIYSIAEIQPEFKGGNMGFLKYINKNIKLVKSDKLLKKIILTFVVEPDGKLTDAKILRGSDNADADAEVLRLANISPIWTPGKMRGKPVRVQYSVPLLIEASSE